MNIFYLSNNVTKCAEQHVDKHCVKMILEYAQLLSTAHRLLDGQEIVGISKTGRKAKRWELSDTRQDVLYSATHINHPSAVWARHSKDNYAWLCKLLDALCKEYTYRYGKVHKVEREGLLQALQFIPYGIPQHTTFTEPTPAMPDEYKVIGSSVASYQRYYNGAKTRMFSWKNRATPEWIIHANI
jgi:hypothetical protein